MPDNFIWTKHVEQRVRQRGVTDNEVWSALKYPDQTDKADGGKYKFSKVVGGKKVVLLASPQGNRWVILTAWIKNLETPGYAPVYGQSLVQRLVKKGVVGSVGLL